MKRVLRSGIGVLLMVFLLSASVLAAPSNEAEGVVTGVESAKDADGIDVTSLLVVQDLPADMQEEVDGISTEAGMKDVLASVGVTYEEGMQVVDIQEAHTIGDVKFPVTIIFQVAGVTPSSKVVLLHYINGAWENIPATPGNGTVTGTFNSLSPVAFVVKKAEAASTVPGGKSPATGMTAPVWPVALAAVAVVGMGVCAYMRKRELSR